MKHIYFLIKIFLFVSYSSFSQTTYFVDEAAGNDSNSGAENKPFKTINYASSLSQPGDIINVKPGTYTYDESNNAWDNILIANSGTEGNYITYRGISDIQGNKPKIISASNAGFTVYDKSYIIIDNFEVTTNDTDVNNVIGALGLEQWRERVGFNIVNSSHHIIVRNCYVHDFRGNGFQCGASDVVLLENNLVEHNAFHSDNGNSGISMYQMKDMNVSGFDEYPNHRLIIKNNIARYNTNLRGFSGFENKMTDGNGIIVDDFRHSQGNNVPYTGRTLIIGNTIYGNGGMGINIFSSDHVDVYNNTMFDNAQTTRIQNPAYEVTIGDSQLQIGDADDISIKNNILYNSGSGKTLKRFNLGSIISYNKNIHWNSTGTIDDDISSNDFIVDPLLKSLVGLTTQQTNLLATMTNPFEENSTSAELREPTVNNNFAIQDVNLTDGSAAIDGGEDHGLIAFDGNGLDIGAKEFNTNLSIFEISKLRGEIKMYPNPAKSMFVLSFMEYEPSTSNTQLTIRDARGRKVYAKSIDPGNLDIHINVNQWRRGVYMVTLEKDNKSITEKLVLK